MSRAGGDTAPTANAEGHLKFGNAVIEFMHDALADAFALRRARVMSRGMASELIKLTGIPNPRAHSVKTMGFLLDIEAMTGGAEEGAGPTSHAGLVNLVPEVGIKNLF